MKKKKFNLSIFFILTCVILLLFDDVENFLIYFLVLIIHELAHAFVAKKLGYKLNNLYIMPYGVCLNYSCNIFANNDEIYIALAGPLINIFLCVFSLAIWWLFPELYYYLDYFCFCNLLFALYNLIPCFPLDGGRVLVALLSRKIDREKAVKISYVCNYIISALLIILFIISIFIGINFSYMFVAIFLFSGTISTNKYTNYNYLSLSNNRPKIFKNGTDVKILAISCNVPLYKIIAKFSKYKFNIVYVIFNNGVVKVLSETNIKNLAVKYSPTLTLANIINL